MLDTDYWNKSKLANATWSYTKLNGKIYDAANAHKQEHEWG